MEQERRRDASPARTAPAPSRRFFAMPETLRRLPGRLTLLRARLHRWLTYHPERRFMRG